MRKFLLTLVLVLLACSCQYIDDPNDNNNPDKTTDEIAKTGWLNLMGNPISNDTKPTLSPANMSEFDSINTILDNNNNPCILWTFGKDYKSMSIYFARWNGQQWLDAYGNKFTNIPLASSNDIQIVTDSKTMVVDDQNNVYVAWLSMSMTNENNNGSQDYRNDDSVTFINGVRITDGRILTLRNPLSIEDFNGQNGILFSSKHLPLNEYDAQEPMARNFENPIFSKSNDVVLTWQGWHGVYSETYYYAKLTDKGWVNWNNEVPSDTSGYCFEKNKNQPCGNIHYSRDVLMAYSGSFTGGKRGYFETGISDMNKLSLLDYSGNQGFVHVSIADGRQNGYFFLVSPSLSSNDGEQNPISIFRYKNGEFSKFYHENTNFVYGTTDKLITSGDGSLYRFKDGNLFFFDEIQSQFIKDSKPFLDLSLLSTQDNLKNKLTYICFDSTNNPFIGYIVKTGSGNRYAFARWGTYRAKDDKNVTKDKGAQNPLSVPYICQKQDLSVDTMGVVNDEDQSNAPPPPHIYGEYACGPASVAMILAYYDKLPPARDDYQSIVPLKKPSFGYWVAPSEGFSHNNVDYFEDRFIFEGSVQKKVFGVWGRLTSHGTDSTGQYYGFDEDTEGKLVKLLDECGLEFESFTVANTESQVVMDFITNSIDNGWPILWKSSMTTAGHYIVCTGYKREHTKLKYIINDPFPWGGRRKEQVEYGFNQIQKYNLTGRKLYSIKPKTKAISRSASETLTDFFNSCFNDKYDEAWLMVAKPSDYSNQYNNSVDKFKEMWTRSKEHGTTYLEVFVDRVINDGRSKADGSELSIVEYRVKTENTTIDDNGYKTKQITDQNFGFMKLEKRIGQIWKIISTER